MAGAAATDGPRGVRVCLHCVLARALRAEADSLGLGGRRPILLAHTDSVLLPHVGAVLYRALRSLLQEAATAPGDAPVRLAVRALAGKSHVEVTATVGSGRAVRVLARAFPRHVEGTLERGFLEGLGRA